LAITVLAEDVVDLLSGHHLCERQPRLQQESIHDLLEITTAFTAGI